MNPKKSHCLVCGEPVKPWFETCFECHQNERQKVLGYGKFPEKIGAAEFMKQMGIGRW